MRQKIFFCLLRGSNPSPLLARRICMSSKPLHHPVELVKELYILLDNPRLLATICEGAGKFSTTQLLSSAKLWLLIQLFIIYLKLSRHPKWKNILSFSIQNTRNIVKIFVKTFIYFQNGSHHFSQISAKFETHFWLLFFIWSVFLIDFRSIMKCQRPWKGFGVIS